MPASTAETKATRQLRFRNPLDPPITRIANRFGEKSKEVERFLRFAIVGVSGAIVDFGVLILMQATLLPPTRTFANELYLDPATRHLKQLYEVLSIPLEANVALATSIAFILAVLSNFIWTRLWVYPDSRSRSVRRQLAQFTLISVIGGTARTIWVTTMSFRLGPIILPTVLPLLQIVDSSIEATPVAEAKIGSVVAQLIGMAVIMLWNFFANRYWTYNDVD